jgi:hypothetical protein
MSFQEIQKHLDDIERKVVKSNKIAAKGDKISLRDAIKLGSKGNAIVSTLKKSTKTFGVQTPPSIDLVGMLTKTAEFPTN